jgi:hypothetical protein
MLAAVALHVLVTEGHEGMTDVQVARACERDPAKQAEMREIKAVLLTLLRDDLAERSGKLFKPTRAAERAAKLSF